MPKLKVLSGQQTCGILAEHGFRQIRRKGSHIIMQKAGQCGTVTVPIPNHRELRAGTLRSIIRQSDLARTLFEEGE